MPVPDFWLAAASAVLSLFAFVPYAVDTIRGDARPNRASWLVWSVLSIVAFCALLTKGVWASTLFAGAQCLGTVSIFALGLVRGYGRLVTATEMVVFAIVALALALWSITENPAWALSLTILASAVGGSSPWPRPLWTRIAKRSCPGRCTRSRPT